MFCERCGMQVSDTAAFCSSCGFAVRPQKATQPLPNADIPQPTIETMYPRGWEIEEDIPQKKKKIYQERESILTMREQVPDQEFTKFIDSPDPPLPFWGGKIFLAISSVVGAGWFAYRAYQYQTWEFIAAGIRENVPGVPFVIFTALWLICAVCLLCSKHSRGAASIAGICQIFSAGTAVMEQSTYEEDKMMLYALLSAAIAIIALISAAGGIRMNFDDQAF